MSTERRAYPKNEKTIVKLSEGKGRGVFANQTLQKGEVVEIAPTLAVPKMEMEIFKLTFLQNYFFMDPTGDGDVIALGHASMYNHSTRPNAEWSIGDGHIVVLAKRSIKCGDEILINYGWDKAIYKEVGIVE